MMQLLVALVALLFGTLLLRPAFMVPPELGGDGGDDGDGDGGDRVDDGDADDGGDDGDSGDDGDADTPASDDDDAPDATLIAQAAQAGIMPDEVRELGRRGTMRAMAIAQRVGQRRQPSQERPLPKADDDDKPFELPALDEDVHPSLAAALKKINDHYAGVTKTLRSQLKEMRESEARRADQQRRSEIGRWLKSLGEEYNDLFPTRTLGSLDAVSHGNLSAVLRIAGALDASGDYETEEVLRMALHAAHPAALASIERRRLAKQVKDRQITTLGKGSSPPRPERSRLSGDAKADLAIAESKFGREMFGTDGENVRTQPKKKAPPKAK